MPERVERKPQLKLRQFDSLRDGIQAAHLIHMPQIMPAHREKESIARFGTIFISDHKEKSMQPDIFSKEWVQQEVAKERKKTILPGETPWYHLPGTGFWVIEQVSQLMRNAARKGRENLSAVLKLAEEDIKAHEDEYFKGQLSLKWNLAIGKVDGKDKIICPDYDKATLESVTSKDERDGAVFDMLFGNKEKGIIGVEEKILKAPVGTMVVIVSPEGWSGLTDAAGNSIRYPESQVYVLKKLPDGRLQAYTFRYQASIVENEALQRKLGLTTTETSDQKDRIKNTLMNVAFITPETADKAERPVTDFEDVIALMQETVGGRKEAYDGKTFDDMRAYLHHPERFNQRHPLTEKLINRFQEYAKWRLMQGGTYDEIATDLEIALAFTPTQLGKLYREEELVMVKNDGSGIDESVAARRLVNFTMRPGGINYQQELAHLQQLPGCAGGGGSQVNVTSMGGLRKGEIGNGSEDYEFDHEGTCVACNNGPKTLGPCNICIACDAEMGGKGASLLDQVKSKDELALAA